MLIEASIVLFKCILNSDNRRSSPGVDSRVMSWPTWRGVPETDWATEHVVQRFRKKYFLRRKIFLAEKNIFLAEKNISCGKKYFLRKKYISCGEKFISFGKIYFLRKKYISCGEKYFLRRKNIFLAEKNISCGKIFFVPCYQSASVNYSDWWVRYLLWNCHQKNVTRPYWW